MNWQPIPEIYQDAEISDGLKGIKDKTALLIGSAGTGKTYQLWALVQSAMKRDYRCSVYVLSEPHEIESHRYDYDRLSEWKEFTGTLCVDDLGYRCQRDGSQPTEWAMHVAYCLSDYRLSHNLKTIWTTNLSLERLRDAYGQAVASRLQAGSTINTSGKDRRL